MVARVQDMQGSRRESNGADSDGGSWSSSDALTAEMLTMSGPTEEDGPAQKQIHVPDVSAGTKGNTTVTQLHKYRQIDILNDLVYRCMKWSKKYMSSVRFMWHSRSRESCPCLSSIVPLVVDIC
jgi:hypothetical protein